MRIQIIDLPTQHTGDTMQAPYILVMSEMPSNMESAVQEFRKDGFDHCAGVIATTSPVRIGEESAYEMQRREERSTRSAEASLGLPYGALISATTPCGRIDYVACPEQEEGRGCACSLGAQDCPVNGRTPAAIGVMDIAPETRAVSVTQNEGGTRVAHIAIDLDQTPEELASDVAAIVEEQREQIGLSIRIPPFSNPELDSAVAAIVEEHREYRHIGFCSCRVPGQYEKTCGIPAHRGVVVTAPADVPGFD